MRKVNIDSWKPSDSLTLEENALTTVKSDSNILVVAGPGAGKTELLAQRASFLLETNVCNFPRKILAISFKRDAAFNLKERVRERCGDVLSKRFDSYTFDAFSKLLLDRFYKGLPDEYSISSNYEIVLSDNYILDLYKAEDINFFNQTDRNDILNFHYAPLPHKTETTHEIIRKNVWDIMLKSTDSKLSFKMIMLLTQLLLNSNKKIKEFLQSTYGYVFLDEFQDTTVLQFSFLTSFINQEKNILTAVGDDKQRIMLWAGAKPDIFQSYLDEYNGTELALTCNFRSAPKLVELQNHLILKLLNKKDIVSAAKDWCGVEGESKVWFYPSPEVEKQHLLIEVNKWIEEGVEPRDICVLVKQRLNLYAGELITFLNANGVKARDESEFQDLLTDDLVLFVLNVLSILTIKKPTDQKTNAIQFLINLNSTIDDNSLRKLEADFNTFIKAEKELINSIATKDDLINTIKRIVRYAEVDKIKANYTQYKDHSFFKSVLKNLTDKFWSIHTEINDLNLSLSSFMGTDTIPVMTIHKSKGLEYNTIVFIGLEDSAFWSFEKQPDEDKCAFFVAMSRAKERLVFTFSKKRPNNYGTLKDQSISTIKVFFQELKNSNLVDFEKIDDSLVKTKM